MERKLEAIKQRSRDTLEASIEASRRYCEHLSEQSAEILDGESMDMTVHESSKQRRLPTERNASLRNLGCRSPPGTAFSLEPRDGSRPARHAAASCLFSNDASHASASQASEQSAPTSAQGTMAAPRNLLAQAHANRTDVERQLRVYNEAQETLAAARNFLAQLHTNRADVDHHLFARNEARESFHARLAAQEDEGMGVLLSRPRAYVETEDEEEHDLGD